MQLVETTKDGLKRSYKLTIRADDLDALVTEKIEQSRGEIQIKGFRKGHVPISILKKMYGKSVLGEVMQDTIDDTVRAHFEKTGDKPALQPDIKMLNEKWKEGDDMDVSVEYENLPEIPVIDFSKFKLNKLVAKIDKGTTEEALNNLALSTPDYKKRKKGLKAKSGDQVLLDFVGKIDGVPFEGGNGEDYPLVLGSNSFIPGFESQLINSKEGEVRDVNVTFPEGYGAKDLAGKSAVFSVTVKSVKEPKPAKINDELAKKFGADNLKALKEQINERLKNEFSMASRAVLKKELLDKIDKKVKFDMPPSLVKNEANQIAYHMWQEKNPNITGNKNKEIEPTKEQMQIATRRVKLGLMLADLGNKNSIVVSEQEIQGAIREKAQQYPGQEKSFFEYIEKNDAAKEQIKAPLFEEKVIDFIFELASITEKSVAKTELNDALKKIETA